ncbi:MAG: c-type cytochrome [Nitrospira sp.]|nr:MAG: c-type cytochrome [Nitrospira sp.]
MMFVAYAVFGTLVFLLLDAPSMPPVSGSKAVIGLLVFYLVLSAAYITAASLWPQYDPEDERGKINRILEPKRKLAEIGKTEELLARVKLLEEQAKSITDRLKNLSKDLPEADGGAAAGAAGTPAAGLPVDAKDLETRAFAIWQDQECYNCHKLKGEGGKKRGPELDNIGSYMAALDIKTKILDPQSFMAEGFEKEYEKKKMPAKYKEVMDDKDVEVLAAWLSGLKNASVQTPKPIKKK